jgi:hypothetical protein
MREQLGFFGLAVALSACGGSTTTGSSGAAGSGTTQGAGGGGGAGTGGAGGGSVCTTTCLSGFICCDGACVNPNNDILNCRECGRACSGPAPFCNGTCGTAPCSRAPCPDQTICCSDQCCGAGQLCCNVPGPVDTGPRCTDPVGGTCPKGCPECICASPDTPIATPEGARPIASLVPGDLVYSVAHGRVAPVPILEIRRVPAHHHAVARLVMESGVVLEISGVHPTADGRRIGDLHPGDELDGVGVREATVIPYAHDATYDILPDSDTGTYFAGGLLIGSTLASTHAVEVFSATAPTSTSSP